MREKLGPAHKEKQSEEEIQAAKDQAKKEGTANLFEEVETVTPPKLTPKDMVQKRVAGSSKKKPDSVCILCLFLRFGSKLLSSINIRPPISKSRIVSSIC